MTLFRFFGVVVLPEGGKKVLCRAVPARRAVVAVREHLGEHGRLTPDEARSEAKKLLGVVGDGH